jgi:ankyrin repeat protein
MERIKLKELVEKERLQLVTKLVKEFGVKSCEHIIIEILRNDDAHLSEDLITGNLISPNESIFDEQKGHNPLLHLSIAYNANKCLRTLIKNGADKQLKSYSGKKPMELAFLYENNEAVLLLI